MEDKVKELATKEHLKAIKTVDVIQELQLMTWTFCLSTELWEKYNSRKSSVNIANLMKIKYFNDDTRKLSEEVDKLPNNKGGIYLYVIENPIIPNSGSYIMYVGRARKTASESLKKRAKSHYAQYIRHEENERLERLFDNWWSYIYFIYVPIDENDEIDLIEDELITALTPPCNKEYPSPQIRKKLSAFNYS